MDFTTFVGCIKKNNAVLNLLENDNKFIVAGLLGGAGLLNDISKLKINASQFVDFDSSVIDKLINSELLKTYPTSVLIDIAKAMQLYIGSDQPENERIEAALLMSRINFMGTDGVRGKVVLDSNNNFITDLLTNNAFTPDLVVTASFSFATMLKNNDKLFTGDTVVVGNDGRDKAYDWRLNKAVIEGFNRAGLNVIDMGIIPTAIVPWKMLQKGYRAGAVLTASHNPSNQNGIKFFVDGKKLLPEGHNGDYDLSANMYKNCMLENMSQPSGSLKQAENVVEESVEFINSVLPENIDILLKDLVIVYDSANGATDVIGRRVLDDIAISYTSKNEVPTGDNINRNCGVAEIEGTELFKGNEYEKHIPFVKEIFDKGRVNEAGKVWGIPLDGDGDRGFLMYYDKDSDNIHVLDGDKCGYILSEYFIKKDKLDPAKYWFISTIESDIMTATCAEDNLGLNKAVVSVGDKWICSFKKGEILVGLEISGHLIFPIHIKNDYGDIKTLLSGVGILTGLMSLVAIKELKLSSKRIIEPFEPGFSKTNYIFFVDKSKFYRGSSVWQKDSELVISEIEKLKDNGIIHVDTRAVFEDKEDPNILYINFMDGSKLLGCMFMRNSGTEDKNAVYVKGKSDISVALDLLGKKIQKYHTEVMKNENRVEYIYEKAIMTLLGKTQIAEFDAIKLFVEKMTNNTILESDIFSVIYGLKKEGRITLEDKTLKLVI